MKRIVFGLLLSMTLFSCSNEENKTQNKINARPTVPIINGEVQIGTQVWMTKNLNVSRYRDGTIIPQVTDPTQWANLTTGAWCYYENNTANGTIYGKLYNWYAVAGIYDEFSWDNPVLRKKLAPIGWHVPTNTEWSTLTNYLGGQSIAGGKMKATGIIELGNGLWQNPNTAATNESGFIGLPSGYLTNDIGFANLGSNGYWWSSSKGPTRTAYLRILNYNFGYTSSSTYPMDYCLSVRCIRD